MGKNIKKPENMKLDLKIPPPAQMLIFGILIVLFAWAIWIGSVYNLVLLALFVYIFSKYQIKPEEEALRSLFGKTYVDYCSRVRRWI